MEVIVVVEVGRCENMCPPDIKRRKKKEKKKKKERDSQLTRSQLAKSGPTGSVDRTTGEGSSFLNNSVGRVDAYMLRSLR